MLIPILTAVLTAIPVAIRVWYGKNRYKTNVYIDTDLFDVLAVSFGLFLLIELMIIGGQRMIVWPSTKAEYTVLAEQIDNARNEGVVTDAYLLKQVVEMNNTIQRHKVFVGNLWIGCHYSEEIANLPKLELKTF